MKKVYAVCDAMAYDPNNNEVWTISEDPNKAGWETDSGYSGYGLPKEKADFYVMCINKYIEEATT
jgi:hypothetical protein